jgi:hypothetical protein
MARMAGAAGASGSRRRGSPDRVAREGPAQPRGDAVGIVAGAEATGSTDTPSASEPL